MSGRNNLLKVFSLFLLLSCTFIFGQKKIYGVVESDGLPVKGVRVSINKSGEQNFSTYTFTDEKGYYELAFEKEQVFVVSFSALGYADISKNIDVEIDNTINVSLAEKVQEIKEVIIVNSKLIGIKKDTIEISAKAFLQGNEKNVEDLLKKIPGIRVSEDGTIKIGDKEVEKVMVENDDFFEKGYKLLTQSMSVQPIEKIQVLQHYSNNKHLKGIENSDKVALNLTLKEGSKRQWFGSANVSSTFFSDHFYNVGLNAMNFGKKNKYYFLASANTNGEDLVGSINHLIYSEQENEPGSIGTNISLPTVLENNPSVSNFDYKRTNFNNDKLLSLNTILNEAKGLKIKLVAFANLTSKNFYRTSETAFQFEDTNFKNSENYTFEKDLQNYFTRLDVTYDINKKTTLEYRGKYGKWIQDDEGFLNFNEAISTENYSKKPTLNDHQIMLTSKLSENKAWINTLKYTDQNEFASYSQSQNFYGDFIGGNSNSGVLQEISNQLKYFGIKSYYLNKINAKNLYEISISGERKTNQFQSQLFLTNEIRDRISGFRNNLRFKTDDFSALLKYSFKTKAFEISPKMDFHFINNLTNRSQFPEEQKYFYVNPQLNLKWNIHKKGELNASFSYSKYNIDVLNVVPNYYLDGFQNFNRGLTDLGLQSTMGGNLSYNYGKWTDGFFLLFSAGYNLSLDYITKAYEVSQNYTLSEDIWLKDRSDFSFNSEMNIYIKPIISNIKLIFNTRISNYENSINGTDFRDVRSTSIEYGLEMRSAFRSFINYSLSSKFTNLKFEAQNTSTLLNNKSLVDLYFKISKQIRATVKNELYYFDGSLSDGNNSYFFGDVLINYQLKNSKINFTLTGKNLYNNTNFKIINIADYYSSETSFRILPRHIMLGMDFNF